MSSIVKIVRNVTSGSDTWGGVVIAPSTSYEIPQTQWTEWAVNPKIIQSIRDGELVVNNGELDFNAELGELHLKSGLVFVHEDVNLPPAAGAQAPALEVICPAAIGYKMLVGEKIYGQTRVDGLVGDFLEFQIHMTVDNSDADRWVEFELSYFTTNGRDDLKPINVADGTVTMGPTEIPTTPFAVFQTVVQIPTTAFDADENYLFVGVERRDPVGKTSPTNPPYVLRYCKRYFRVDN